MHPKVSIEILTSAEEKHLTTDQIDVGFRIGPQLENADFVAKPVRTVGLACYASPQYLSDFGVPNTPEELADHECVLMRLPNGAIYNRWVFGGAKEVLIKGSLTVNAIQVAVDAGIHHRGVIYVAETMVEDLVEQGMLVRLFPELDTVPHYGWVIHRKVSELTPCVEQFIDYLVTELEKMPL